LAVSLSEFKREYTRAVSEGYAAIFAGAGLSRSSGFANWKELLRNIARDIGLDIDKETDLVAVSQYYKNEKGSRRYDINQTIINEFTKNAQGNKNIEILTRLPIFVYWTTNYDELIEDGLKQNNRKPDIKVNQNSLANNIYDRDAVVYKMHGDVRDPEQAVITKDDYETYNQKRALFTTALQGDLISKTFLFIGFSFEDPAFLLISHDISFLNSVVNLIYHIEDKEVTRYVGNYNDFERVYEDKKSQLESAYKRQQQEIAELEDFVARNKARVATRNMAMSRQKKLNKMDIIELAREKPKPEFKFKAARTAGKLIFETKDLVIGYDSPLSKPLNLRMERGQRIAIVGANGIGKTTFMKSILGQIKPYEGEVELGDTLEIGYFEQEIKGKNDRSCIEEIWQEFPSWTQYEVRAALAKCGLTTNHIESKIMVLSGGEQAKVRLCKILNRETNILLLDEPTNHLDVDAKDELKRSLKEYKGVILLISHEPEFYQDVATEIWNLEQYSTKLKIQRKMIVLQ